MDIFINLGVPSLLLGFPGGSVVKNLPAMQETWVQSLGCVSWSREWKPPVFLPGEFHGETSLEGYSPWDHKESDTTKWLTHIQSCYWVLFGCYGANLAKEAIAQELHFLSAFIWVLFRVSPQRSIAAVFRISGEDIWIYVRSNMLSKSGCCIVSISLQVAEIHSFWQMCWPQI